MNPSNDPLIEITLQELESILRSRKARGLESKFYPRSAPEVGRLPFQQRLWYVAEFMLQSKAAERKKEIKLAKSWRDRAQTIASEIAREANADTLRKIADALDCKHLPEAAPSKQHRVLSEVNDFCGENGKMPTRKQLIERGLRGDDVTEVCSNLSKLGTFKLPKHPGQGRKPKK